MAAPFMNTDLKDFLTLPSIYIKLSLLLLLLLLCNTFIWVIVTLSIVQIFTTRGKQNQKG